MKKEGRPRYFLNLIFKFYYHKQAIYFLWPCHNYLADKMEVPIVQQFACDDGLKSDFQLTTSRFHVTQWEIVFEGRKNNRLYHV